MLQEIGAGDIPQVLVFNKIDLTDLDIGVARDECGKISRIWVSAREQRGLEHVRAAIQVQGQGSASDLALTAANQHPIPTFVLKHVTE